jgi:MFS family permease
MSSTLISFGYNYSWGVFLNYYNKNVYVNQLATLSWIGSTCVSLFFFLGPVNRLVIEKMGYRNMLIVGNIICPLALILASFAYEMWHVFLTQGVLFGLGASFIWFPCIGASQQWFSERRGLAIGLAMSGSGIGGLVVANIAQAAISNVGYRWALRIIGIMAFVLLLITTCTVRPLGHIKQTGGQDQLIAWYLFKNPQFVVIFLHGLITTFGYMVSTCAASFPFYIIFTAMLNVGSFVRHHSFFFQHMQIPWDWTHGSAQIYLQLCQESTLSLEYSPGS